MERHERLISRYAKPYEVQPDGIRYDTTPGLDRKPRNPHGLRDREEGMQLSNGKSLGDPEVVYGH